MTTKVGVPEFRAGLADYIASETPVAVTRHGQTVGFFIPTKTDLTVEISALKSAAEKLDALLEAQRFDIEQVVSEFKDARRKAAG